MIFDPDGKHALCDDGRMAVPVFTAVLNDNGFPTGERRQIGWMEPGSFGLPANTNYVDLD